MSSHTIIHRAAALRTAAGPCGGFSVALRIQAAALECLAPVSGNPHRLLWNHPEDRWPGAELARLAGVPQSATKDMHAAADPQVRDCRTLPRPYIDRIARALGVNAAWLSAPFLREYHPPWFADLFDHAHALAVGTLEAPPTPRPWPRGWEQAAVAIADCEIGNPRSRRYVCETVTVALRPEELQSLILANMQTDHHAWMRSELPWATIDHEALGEKLTDAWMNCLTPRDPQPRKR